MARSTFYDSLRLFPDFADAVTRAENEGIARIEALGYRRLTDLGGPALAAVRTVGVGARNTAWSGIRCRVLGVDLMPAKSEEAAVGVATLALKAIR